MKLVVSREVPEEEWGLDALMKVMGQEIEVRESPRVQVGYHSNKPQIEVHRQQLHWYRELPQAAPFVAIASRLTPRTVVESLPQSIHASRS